MTLIFDNRYKGHHFEYIRHLIDYLIEHSIFNKSYIFLLHPKIIGRLKQHYLSEILTSFTIVPIPPINKKTTAFQEIREEVKIIEAIIESYGVTDLIFLFLDPYQWVIGQNYFKKVRISGILFYSSLRLTALSRWQGVSMRLKKWLKLKQLEWCKRNPNLQTIFILQDATSAAILNKKFDLSLFKSIIDPIEDIPVSKIKRAKIFFPEIAKHKGKFIGLVFGCISTFKNIPNIIAAMQLLDATINQEVVLVIAGVYVSPEEAEYIENLLLQNKNLAIIRINRYIDTREELVNLFESCSVVLLPYINFFGSSGVLGHAARYQKLVLAANVGIINDLVKEYELGLTCNPIDPSSIKEALIQLRQYQTTLEKTARFNHFLSSRKPSVFAETLLLAND